MKISYNWLKEFIRDIPLPEELSKILTGIGLEVEHLEKFEEIKGSLSGLLVGQIIQCGEHPNAEKLKLTQVDLGNGNISQIVCGAPNVDIGQKVIVAPAGSTIFPVNKEAVVIKRAKIRGVESNGMICAEDEIGIGNDHAGIIILPENTSTGSPAADFYKPETDWVFDIGLTPNRIDAMSHVGVAKDVCAYLSHYNKKPVTVNFPTDEFVCNNNNRVVNITIENTKACHRYAGVSITGIKVEPSPKWIQVKLKSIGVKPVNNIVDVTNYILHQTGQPLHAFDLQAIKGNRIRVKNLPQDTPFVTLDEKERKLNLEDLMICNGEDEAMCFAGVFGGLQSGVKNSTTEIFLESAWFDPSTIRRTSIRQNLRTDAAIRFEKGVDISSTVVVLKHAAMMIKQVTGGEITSDIIDVYPNPKRPISITVKEAYLKKLTGKDYDRHEVKNILISLGFAVEKEDVQTFTVTVPFSKPDVTLPADIIEEIMRIDGFDNVKIPLAITIAPAVETNSLAASYKETIANYLTGAGFSEIFTNSITNSKYYDEQMLANTVKIVNSLSAGLDIMRPLLMETGLESVAYNLNRKNNDLLLFEIGNTYATAGLGKYAQEEHLCLYISGNTNQLGWNKKPVKADYYFLKGICGNIFNLCGVANTEQAVSKNNKFEMSSVISHNNTKLAEIGLLHKNALQRFDIKQPVFFADINWQNLLTVSRNKIVYNEIAKFPAVSRDLSIVVGKKIKYEQVEGVLNNLNIKTLSNIKLFDVFESEKLGIDKKAFAINLTFINTGRTLTDKETDGWMAKIIDSLKNNLGGEIRK